ncbi:serine hydrolase domain-containing protein [Microbacterium aureliae]
MSASSFSAAFDWARRAVDDGRLPTAVVGIATADGTVALDAFGATGERRARVDDHYRLFSITKTLVGLVAARAVERGLLTPDTPLTHALPDFGAGREDTVRLRHLVSHTSGIPEPALDAPQGLRAALLASGRDFAAGAFSRYSSVAFEGIAAMTARATARTWEDDLAEWAAEIGADGLTLDEAADPHKIPDAAAAGLDMARFAALRHPGAGVLGRAADLLALGSALLRTGTRGERTVVTPATLRMMRRPLTGGIPRLDPLAAEQGQDWGFTFNLRTNAPGLIDQDCYGHSGWPGTEFWVHPSAGIAWVLLTNRVQRVDVDVDELDNAVVSGV